MRKVYMLTLLLMVLTSISGVAYAHDHRTVDGYTLVVGFLVEPAYEGVMNGLDIRVTKELDHSAHENHKHSKEDESGSMDVKEHGGVFGSPALGQGQTFRFEVMEMFDGVTIPYHNHQNHEMTGLIKVSHNADLSGIVEIEIHDDMYMPSDVTVQPGTVLQWTNISTLPQTATSGEVPKENLMEGHHQELPVEGLEETLNVEIVHLASGISKQMRLRPVFHSSGQYTADLIPTSTGVYEIRLYGTIEDTQINESFISKGGGGGFSDVESSEVIQFPASVIEIREIEAATRGVQKQIQILEDMVSTSDNNVRTAVIIAAVGVISGVMGMILGVWALMMLNRRRE